MSPKVVLTMAVVFTSSITVGSIATGGSETLYPSERDRKLSPGDTTYYIDPAVGSDTNSGVQPRSANTSNDPDGDKSLTDAGYPVELIHGPDPILEKRIHKMLETIADEVLTELKEADGAAKTGKEE